MIARPLDLVRHLRPPPRNLDALFFVNVGLVALFFFLFGSRFVLAPGLGVDFRVPEKSGAGAGAQRTTHQIAVKGPGQIFADDGLVSVAQLDLWLQKQKAAAKHPVSLLILASYTVPNGFLAEITSVAQKAGFSVVWGALEPATTGAAKAK
jgi:biopolymer transport protein ExbD